MSGRFSDSYDLVIQIEPFNEQHKRAWTWHGQPMRELGAVQNRAKRTVKSYGKRLLAWKIVLNRLNMITGEVEMSIVEENRL